MALVPIVFSVGWICLLKHRVVGTLQTGTKCPKFLQSEPSTMAATVSLHSWPTVLHGHIYFAFPLLRQHCRAIRDVTNEIPFASHLKCIDNSRKRWQLHPFSPLKPKLV
jgi:hypothetical protein